MFDDVHVLLVVSSNTVHLARRRFSTVNMSYLPDSFDQPNPLYNAAVAIRNDSTKTSRTRLLRFDKKKFQVTKITLR